LDGGGVRASGQLNCPGQSADVGPEATPVRSIQTLFGIPFLLPAALDEEEEEEW
jgi:hypothetical protein